MKEDKLWSIFARARGGAVIYQCRSCKCTVYMDDGSLPKKCPICKAAEEKK